MESPLTVSVNKCGKNVLKLTDVSPCLTARDYKGFAGKKDMIAVIEDSELPLTVLVNKNGRNLMGTTDISPCLSARDYKGLSGRDGMAAVIEEAREERK